MHFGIAVGIRHFRRKVRKGIESIIEFSNAVGNSWHRDFQGVSSLFRGWNRVEAEGQWVCGVLRMDLYVGVFELNIYAVRDAKVQF